jgi:thioredoxin reductase
VTEDADVLVIGGGPAGLSAATELRKLGAGKIVLLEREGVAGGIPRHCAHSPFGMREFGRILSGASYTARLAERATTAGVDIRLRHSVTALTGTSADIASPDGVSTITARRIVIATGIRETSRAGRLVSGTRPLGILTTGALQDWVHLRHLAPFRRPVIVGSELVTMSAILTCRSGGIRPVAIIEDEPRPRVGYPTALFPRLMGIPVHYRTTIDDILGTRRVEAVRLRHADGTTTTLDCDGVLFTGRFTPESSLARLAGIAIDRSTGGPAIDANGRTSQPNIYATGNVLRAVHTAGQCWSEGRAVARAIARSLERA